MRRSLGVITLLMYLTAMPVIGAPLCPKLVSILPDTFPTNAIVISESTDHSNENTFDLAMAVLEASSSNPPKVFLPVRVKTYQEIFNKISNLKINQVTKEAWLRNLIFVPGSIYEWQQDSYEFFVNSKGATTVRRVTGTNNYWIESERLDLSPLFNAFSSAGVTIGKDLPSLRPSTAYLGGNIESLPGNICLLGDSSFYIKEKDLGTNKIVNEWASYSKSVCGSSTVLKVPTRGLYAAHTDEVIKAIPHANGSGVCDFSILLASPRLALELLAQASEEPFFDWPKAKLFNLVQTESVFKEICRSSTDCSLLKNRDILSFLKRNSKWLATNRIFQDNLDTFKSQLILTLKRQLPQCRPNIIEIPQILGDSIFDEGVVPSLTIASTAQVQLLPNPINSIVISKTLIAPDPGNSAFRRALVQSLARTGLSLRLLDLASAHFNGGGAHCLTNIIKECKAN